MMMPFELYFWFVTICGIIYSGLSQFVRRKFVDMDRMKEVQKEMNKLNKDYFAAMKSQNTRLMDEIKAKQDKVMPEFNGMMGGQMKVMLVIIVIFMGFMWMLGAIDPHIEDDIVLELVQDGEEWCGEVPLNGETGPWHVGVKAFEGEGQRSENGTIFFYGVESSEFLPSSTITGEQMHVFTDKESYSENEDAVVCVVPPANTDRVVATANNGTWFHVGLPFEIPILNTRTLNGVNIWFILIAIVGGIGMSRVMNKKKK